MKLFLRHVASLMIVAVILFFSGNTVFVHSHDTGDSHIVHSHPFAPGAHHSHSDQALQLIAFANQAVQSVECMPALQVLIQAPTAWTAVITEPETGIEKTDCPAGLLRGPPARARITA